MRKLVLVIVFCFACVYGSTTFAQNSIRVNFSTQPMWGPEGYDYVGYYYLPDIQVYYNVARHRYYYQEHGHWISRSQLPQRYRDYDVYGGRKVIINESRPYLHNKTHRERYSGTTDYSNQKSIRDSQDERYFQNKRHPEHKQWLNNKRNGRHDQNQNSSKEQNNNQNNNQKHDKNKRNHGK
jgi:hypothetical protein